MKRGPWRQTLMHDWPAKLHTRVQARRQNLERLLDPRFLIEAKLTDYTLFRTLLELLELDVSGSVHFYAHPIPSGHPPSPPAYCQGRRLPRVRFPRRTWRWIIGLHMLITLPTPNVEEMLVGLREVLQKPRVGLKGRTLEVTERLF